MVQERVDSWECFGTRNDNELKRGSRIVVAKKKDKGVRTMMTAFVALRRIARLIGSGKSVFGWSR